MGLHFVSILCNYLCACHHVTPFSSPHSLHLWNMIKKGVCLIVLLSGRTHGYENFVQHSILFSASLYFTWIVLKDTFSKRYDKVDRNLSRNVGEYRHNLVWHWSLSLGNSLLVFTWKWRQLWPSIMDTYFRPQVLWLAYLLLLRTSL